MRRGKRWAARSRTISAVGLVAGALALLATPAVAAAGSTERVSDSRCCSRDSFAPAISADGRFVAFLSYTFLSSNGSLSADVLVHDRQTGTSERVNVEAFTSAATNLVPGDFNQGPDVFIHDRQTGTTQRVSVDSAGHEGNSNSISFWPAISASGRVVAFSSFASNLVPGDTNRMVDAFVHDGGGAE